MGELAPLGLTRQSREFLDRLAHEPACWVQVDATEGSTPREKGAWMAVFADQVVGTIGGGQLEFQAIDWARARLMGAPAEPVVRCVLGPSLGQCCGGVMYLRFDRVAIQERQGVAEALHRLAQNDLQPVALFGGGHVGQALVSVLATLPTSITWIDSRDEIFPSVVPPNVQTEHSDPVQRAVADLVPGCSVLIMSFSHAEDLDIVGACLARQRAAADLPYVGLIGSATKWASFGRRLRERGFTEAELAQVTSPIGVPGIEGKEPEVIAVAVAAQLLQVRSRGRQG